MKVILDPSLKPGQAYLIDTKKLYWKPPKTTLWERVKCRWFGIHRVGWTGLTCLVCGKVFKKYVDGKVVDA